MKNTTAMVSCFARAYHRNANAYPVFDDTAAQPILGEEYRQIAQSMAEGAGFFLPEFKGTPEECLRLIVDRQLAPSVLARSAFCEEALKGEAAAGCGQYVIFAAGYDTFAIRSHDEPISVFELDMPDVQSDKRLRIARAGLRSSAVYIPCDLADPSWTEKLEAGGYRLNEKAFCGMLGISYYLRRSEFKSMLDSAGKIMAAGSMLCLDYPSAEEGRAASVNRALAREAGEQMQASYSSHEMEELLTGSGFIVREHLSPQDMTRRLFSEHNRLDPENRMAAPEGVRYILAARR